MSAPKAPEQEEFSRLLDDQMCFALYAASRAVTALYRPILDELGLTYPQYLVMLLLWERGSVPVKAVGEALHLDYGTLSPLLKRLAAAGLVRRERRADDERSVLVALTDEGVALRERAAGIPSAIGTAMALDGAEFGQLGATLRRLTANVSSAAAARAGGAATGGTAADDYS
jgi:DNA-binding MarR family transcriptional regulator